MFEQWLKCVVFKGMFNDELAVEVTEKTGGAVSFFVPRNTVRDTGGSAMVRVRVYHQGDTTWAIFPSEDATAVPVRDSDLAAT